MKIYMCDLCNKIFKQKSHYDKHIFNKKNPCVNEKVNIEKHKSNNQQDIHTISTKSLKTPHNNTEILHNVKNTNINKKVEYDIINEHKKYICEYCNLICARSDSLNRHIDKYCKNKKHIENVNDIQSKINEKNNILNHKYEKMEKDILKLQEDNKKLIEILDEYKLFIKENNLLKQAIPSSDNLNSNNLNSNNVNNINNTINGSVNNGTVNNNTTINNIVQFGKEDISKLNLMDMMNIYLQSTGGNIFPNMLKYINLNPNFPQNFNILMGDLARENVKIHNGKKFITKKFKNVKGDILNSLSNHITNMCDNYMENPKTKKNDDVLSKMKINNISRTLINNDDITPLLTIKKEKKENLKKIKNTGEDVNEEINDNKSVNSDDSEEYLDFEGEKKLVHYENKRQGLQEITMQKLKDELYNNKDLIENHHKYFVM